MRTLPAEPLAAVGAALATAVAVAAGEQAGAASEETARVRRRATLENCIVMIWKVFLECRTWIKCTVKYVYIRM